MFLFFLLGSLFYLPMAAQAHFIQTDGSMLIMLHANPDDDPIIGQDANLTFYITDSQKKFKLAQCDCQLTISLNNTVIFSTSTVSNNLGGSPVFSYVFSQKGIYTIQFIAKPLTSGGFQNFKFSYDMRVDRTVAQAVAAKASVYHLYIILGAILLLIILFFNYKKFKKGIVGTLVLLLTVGVIFHQPQILCPEHMSGNQTGQHDCCFIPLIDSNQRFSIDWLPALSEIKTTKLQQPAQIKIIFVLNNKAPPQSV